MKIEFVSAIFWSLFIRSPERDIKKAIKSIAADADQNVRILTSKITHPLRVHACHDKIIIPFSHINRCIPANICEYPCSFSFAYHPNTYAGFIFTNISLDITFIYTANKYRRASDTSITDYHHKFVNSGLAVICPFIIQHNWGDTSYPVLYAHFGVIMNY